MIRDKIRGNVSDQVHFLFVFVKFYGCCCRGGGPPQRWWRRTKFSVFKRENLPNFRRGRQKVQIISRPDLWCRFLLIHHYGKVSFATIVATPFMRSITSFAIRQHRFPTANENDICAFGAKWCSSLRSEIRPYGSWSPSPQGKADGYRSSLVFGIRF